MQTTGGDHHVKFSRPAGEARRGPANELIASRLLGQLGVDRGEVALVELPGEVRAADPTLADVIGNLGLGMPRLAPATDVAGSVLDSSRDTADRDVLAQVVVLRWLQNTDHAGTNNWMVVGDRLMAVDYASTPTDDVWRGATQIGSGIIDHGGLNGRIAGMDASVSAQVRGALDRIDEETVRTILSQVPAEWATDDEKAVMLAELMRRKEELLAELQ